MESLHLSQVLADLSNLGAAEPDAAAAIVTANVPRIKVDPQPSVTSNPQSPRSRPSPLKRSWSSEPGVPPKFDKLGRRILVNSSASRPGSAANSTPGTPRPSDSNADDDWERASTLMALYDIRAKIKQQDNSSLLRAREKINALAAKQQAAERNIRASDELRRHRYSFPKPGL
ncbi:hypothetical protein E4U43_005398 [Claviceps pusilla]|uniref:Uncharacterized protein n=1 Tax=Claviceps pusilla TaxID=123648 RepID=A0A9P7N488_9HYPO|nr:hypothetical protein E4U43_005398 [Claviceps pusilla]KAG6011858.1 hypothetical protein E4U54_007866 [Claviceps lovelessii]